MFHSTVSPDKRYQFSSTTTLYFIHSFPLPHHHYKHRAVSAPRLLSPRKPRTTVTLSLNDTGAQDVEVTCGDVVREWILARDSDSAIQECPDTRSCAAGRVTVLFVGQDNTTFSAAAEAIFTDICKRRALDCFSCHSVGISVREGDPPDKTFVDALRFKRGLDISRKMACLFDRSDLDSYNLVICMDEHTRSQLLYMAADNEGRFNDSEEEKVVVLSTYCTDPKLQSTQFSSGYYSQNEITNLMSALVDACNGLLVTLIKSPPMPKS